MTALFVSDLHLDASRPAATNCFLHFLAGPAREASALYILGDLFEAWCGDDAANLHDREVLRALKRYAAAGCRHHFLKGNRDFLVGAGFAAESGAMLLADETIIEIDTHRILLMHGDTLCTDDHAYQRYRRFVRRPAVQSLYLSLPASFRSGIAASLRRRSMHANAGKPAAIMDVNPEAVAEAFSRYGVRSMIHGHTHRPAIHTVEVDGQPARRIVLGAWYEQGSVLAWTGKGPELLTLGFA